MPSDDVARSEAQRAQTMRTAIISGAIGSVAGAVVVMATVATVLSFVNSSPIDKETAAASKTTVAPSLVAAPAAPEKPSPSFNRLAESPAGKEGCEDQTWPNIESRCLTRVDNTPRETTGGPVARPPVIAAPAELQPGSSALPNPSALFESRSLAATPAPTAPQPQPQANAPQLAPKSQPAPQAVEVRVNGQPHLVPPATDVTTTSKPLKATATKPARKTAERPRPPKIARPIDDDDDDIPTVTISRDRGTIYRDRGTTRQVIEEVIERPAVRYRSSTFGSIFRDGD